MKYCVYDGQKIIGFYQGSNPELDLTDSYAQYAGAIPAAELVNNHYWDGSAPAPKQHFTLDAIPLPATAIIEGVEYSLTEQPTFEFDRPGIYEITVDAGVAYYVETFTVDHSA